MTDRFESILDECISALQAGVPLEEVLAEVPEYADELRPLLLAAMVLTEPRPEALPEEHKAALRAEYMRHVAELPEHHPVPWMEKLRAVLHIIRKRATRQAVIGDLLTVLITVLVTMMIAAGTLYFLAQDSLPGDALYSLKRISESVQLSLTADEASRHQLEERFNRRRLQEIETLIRLNRAAVVEFTGVVQTQGENLWIIENFTVFLPNDVQVPPDIKEGDRVEVVGLLRTNNVLVADTIRLAGGQ